MSEEGVGLDPVGDAYHTHICSTLCRLACLWGLTPYNNQLCWQVSLQIVSASVTQAPQRWDLRPSKEENEQGAWLPGKRNIWICLGERECEQACAHRGNGSRAEIQLSYASHWERRYDLKTNEFKKVDLVLDKTGCCKPSIPAHSRNKGNYFIWPLHAEKNSKRLWAKIKWRVNRRPGSNMLLTLTACGVWNELLSLSSLRRGVVLFANHGDISSPPESQLGL